MRRGIRRDSLLYARNGTWLLSCLGLGNRFIFESHMPPTDPSNILIQRRLFRHERFLGLVVVTEALKAAYLSAFPRLSPEKIVVAPDAADDVDAENRGSPEPVGRFQVGYVGHLYPGRGGELMVEAARALPDADFHLIGGRAEDIARLKGWAPPDNLVFHGHRPPAELPGFYRRLDAVVAPYQRKVAVAGGGGDISRWMSPMKLFEYMSFAKPIVASDLPVLREVLTPGENALLVEPDDVAGWVRALRRLMDDPDERRTLGERGHAAFRANHTWKIRASRILDALA